MSYKDWTPERQAEYWRRIKKIKAAHPDKFYPSEYHHIMLEINLKGAEGMANLEAAFQTRLFPFAGWNALSGEGAQLPKSVRRFASQALVHAAALGDVELCEKLHKELGADVNTKDGKNTALACAVERRRLPAARWLLEHNAKIMSNRHELNPMLSACADGCVPVLNMFKHYGIDFNTGYTYWLRSKRMKLPQRVTIYPLAVAACQKQPKAVQFLIDNGASIDVPCFGRGTPTIRNLVDTGKLDKETNLILAKKAAETPAPQKVVKKSWSLFQRASKSNG